MSVGSPTPMSGWQRANVLAAAQYVGAVVSRSPGDVKAQVVHQGLLEVLEPVRRTLRQQRELSEAVRSAGDSAREAGGARTAASGSQARQPWHPEGC